MYIQTKPNANPAIICGKSCAFANNLADATKPETITTPAIANLKSM